MTAKNKFSNLNVDPWWRFIFRKNDRLTSVGPYFLSRLYATSPRFFPLYENSKDIRIVLFKGSRIKGVDRVILKLIPLYLRIFARKFDRYQWLLLFSTKWSVGMLCNQLLHFDDPEYTKGELLDIFRWESYVTEKGKKTQIVCTSEFTREYLLKNEVASKVEVIPQGHSMSMSELQFLRKASLENNKKLRLVYASPSIDIQGDVHGGHINWDASVLLSEIWPRLQETGRFELHLVGKIGINAGKILSDEYVVKHGLVSISECSAILQNCDIGLYPRVRDNFRQAQKISEYIGAGLAIVAFRLIDTSLVESLGVGVSVDSIEEFVQAIQELENDRDRLESLKFKSRESSSNLHWSSLAAKLDQISR